MPTFDITAPNGEVFEVTGETAEGALKALQKSLGTQTTEQLQPVSQVKDVGKSLGSGLVRGGIGLLELPELVGRGVARFGQEGLQAAGLTESKDIPVLDTATGRFLREATTLDDYVPQTTAGEYAGTIGEFLPAAVGGPAGLAKRLGTMAVAGTGSEALGQAFEDTSLEVPGRLVGGLFAPSTVKGITNKTVNAFTKKASTETSLETLRNAKNASYKAFDSAGGKLSANMDDLARNMSDEISENDLFLAYAKGSKDGQYIDGVLKAVDKFKGQEFNLAQLDKLRSSLYITYKNSNFDPRVAALRNKVDDFIENTAASGNEKALKILEQARANNRSYKKVELFDELIKRAELQTGATGSGGNIVNKYRQALNKIVSNPTNRAKYDQKELEIMERLIKGNVPNNFLRLIGKLSPNGNGLMTFLNFGAAITDPAFLFITGTGLTSKALAERSSKKAIQNLREILATGTKKGKRFSDTEIRSLAGFLAGQEREEQSMTE